jgi:hypothetical protein
MIRLILSIVLTLMINNISAGQCIANQKQSCACIKDYEKCCGQMGGVNYCDSSSGKLICNNGYVSSCYCSKRATMDIQMLEGCCLWRGGILDIVNGAIVVCRDGSISMQCTDLNSISQSVQGIYHSYDNDL